MSSFTPGPWRLAGKATIRAGDGWIAQVNWRNREANAAIVIAAPDMYDALKCAQSVLFLLRDEVNALGLKSVNVPDKVNAAIAKADAA